MFHKSRMILMDNYEILRKIGDGTFGTVYLCKRKIDHGNTETKTQSEGKQERSAKSREPTDGGNQVAIKKMKKRYYNWDECMRLREIKALKRLNHKNIVLLIEVIREDNNLYLVFEHMEENLYQLMRRQPDSFPEETIRNITRHIATGLAYIHKHRFFHRDIKPENILCRDGANSIKIADFGLIREIDSRPPFTDYVSTRWYRAPELLLHSTEYSWAVDIWSVGCITGELYILRPMFPGRSEIDQIFKICRTLGTPDINVWPEGGRLASLIQIKFPNLVPLDLKLLIPGCSADGLEFIKSTLRWTPNERPKSKQLTSHRYLSIAADVSRFLRS